MTKPLDVSQRSEDYFRIQNMICSNRFLNALVKHHGQFEEREPEEVQPKPLPKIKKKTEPKVEVAPDPFPENFPPLHKVEVIKRVICRRYNIPLRQIESATRKANVVRPRQIAMYLVRQHTTHSYAEIGRRLGGRDHTTILHAFRKIGELRERDRAFAIELEALEAAIFA